MNKIRKRDNIAGYGFLLPSLIAMVLFVILPVLVAIYYSFTNYKGKAGYHFVGLKNYIRVLSDPCLEYVLKNTAILIFVCVPCIVIISFALAVILAQYFRDSKFGNFSKALIFIPTVCADVIVARIWMNLFADGENGVINLLIRAFGGEMVDWLGQAGTAMFVICFVKTWINVGYFLVIFYAGILEIPKSHLEAAEIDGANKFQQVIHIILPELKPVTYFVITINVIWAFQLYNLVAVMTQGGPSFATTTILYRIQTAGFSDWNLAYANAMSIMTFILILITSFVIDLLFKPKED